MKHSIALMVGAAVVAAALSNPALSQDRYTAAIMKVDPQTVATGYRTSKVVGSTVVNEANETVGTIDDLIVTPSEKGPFAVLSVGESFSWAWGLNMSWYPTILSKSATRRWYSRAPPKNP